MLSVQQLNCPLCNKQYKDQNLPRLLTVCGHTYCQVCMKDLLKQKRKQQKIVYTIECPQDHSILELEKNDVTILPKNIALIKVIQSKKNSISFPQEQSSINVSKIEKNKQLQQQDNDSDDIITAINEGQSEKIQTLQQKQIKQNQQQQVCLLHQKPLQIVCMIDLERICVNCAIFGNHKGHDFKSIEQIRSEQKQYYNSILTIMQKKQNIKERLSNQKNSQQILNILETRKQKLRKQILDKYTKMKEVINQVRNKNLKELDKIVEKTEEKIQNMMKIDHRTQKLYQQWEAQSYQHLKIMESPTIQDKLHILFPATGDKHAIIDHGQQILNLMYTQQQNLIPQVCILFQNISITTSDEPFQSIKSFITFHEQKRQSFVNDLKATNEQSTKKQASLQHDYLILTPPVEQSLLDMDMDDSEQTQIKKPQFIKAKEQTLQNISVEKIQLQLNFNNLQKKQEKKPSQKTLRNSNIVQTVTQRPSKKKLSKIKIPEKYEKVVDALIGDTLQIADFTNAQLGDNNLNTIMEFVRGSKVKTLKLIRNKLSDDGIKKMLPYFGNIVTLNLSQNLLTDNILDIIFDNFGCLPNIKNLILSQNKIIERKHKAKIEKLRKMDLIVSV